MIHLKVVSVTNPCIKFYLCLKMIMEIYLGVNKSYSRQIRPFLYFMTEHPLEARENSSYFYGYLDMKTILSIWQQKRERARDGDSRGNPHPLTLPSSPQYWARLRPTAQDAISAPHTCGRSPCKPSLITPQDHREFAVIDII